nr:probable transmembrane ascorbate ferrireductase 4 [Tanacetum cinerariifolium]
MFSLSEGLKADITIRVNQGEVRMTRIHVLPWHVFLGLYAYGLAVVTAETGHLEKLTFLQTKGVVFKRCNTRTVGEALASSKRGQCSYLSPTGSLAFALFGCVELTLNHFSDCYKKSAKRKRSGKLHSTLRVVDYEMLEERVMDFLQHMLLCGGSLYLRDWDYGKFRQIADKCGAVLIWSYCC